MARDVLPSVDRDASELLADRRVLAVLAVVVVVTGGAAGLFLYHPAPGTPSSAPFATDDPPVPVNGSYRVVGQTRATQRGEGTTYAERTRTYVPGEPAVALGRWTFGGGADRTTVSYYQRGTTEYVRQTWANVSEYRSSREHLSNQTRSEGDFFHAVNITRTIYRTETREKGVDAAPAGSIALSALATLPYERRGTTTYRGREVVRYVPRTGWVTRGTDGNTLSARVGAASGEMLVDPATGAVLFADVEATTTQADTWGRVLMEPAITLSVEYRVTPGVENPGSPPWIREMRDAINATADTTRGQ
ncbi:MAG: hypothetical protein ABEH66_07975 [Halobacteriales archaeon]